MASSLSKTPRVADVGAGTGKLTRGLVAAGCDVVALDPDSAMLGTLRTAVPGIPTYVGTAESLPLDDGTVDAVVLGQAWHWVDPGEGSTEIGRVLRPGGVLGLIWNVRDDSVPWVRQLNSIVPDGGTTEMFTAGPPPVAKPFGDPARKVWQWSSSVTRASLAASVRSRSYYIIATPEARAEVDSRLEALFDDLGLRGEETVELPYETRAFRYTRQ
ncbi:class I SAM-dependent methyltransferase [Rhodococcus sp. G-MC3]|uniref:class I SAM-dependent methyltransferase n=1 Tax=Rhodococcus sp. G-MC3 TaxID=3046209 RepID=UPI0024B8D9CE|nr:class I SAM-dependent methyltransferase [Rhodococcus sp. G-MC3]MDJ0395356.1 class I SAM-dependent methyltransferase [Rhodococcus sp. G-MC3]